MTTDITFSPDPQSVRLTSRKFIIALLVLLVASLFLAFGVIVPLLWRDVVFAVLASYFTSNVAQKVMASKAAAT